MTADPRKNLNDYARFSGIAIQMLAVILLGVFGGFKLDQWLNTRPILTVVFSIISVALSIYLVTRDFLRK